MSNKLSKTLLVLAVVFAMMLAGCAPAATPTAAPAQTEAPAAQATEPPTAVVTEAPTAEPPTAEPPTAEPTEEPKPEIDPTGQTVAFWHVWGTGLPNETMLGIVDDFNASNEWGITVDAIDQGQYNNLEDAFNAPA
jgi:ABC-type glycerol-3-phosphate transport system substrate-binding protein